MELALSLEKLTNEKLLNLHKVRLKSKSKTLLSFPFPFVFSLATSIATYAQLSPKQVKLEDIIPLAFIMLQLLWQQTQP